MADDASIYVFHADTEGLNFRKAFSDAGFTSPGRASGRSSPWYWAARPYQWQHEPILFGWKKKGRHQWYTRAERVHHLDKPKKNKDHPTMKPIPLLAYPIPSQARSAPITERTSSPSSKRSSVSPSRTPGAYA